MFKLNTKDLKILTTDGYRSFAGIQKLNKDCVALTTDSCSLSCSINHYICTNKDKHLFKPAGELKINDEIFTIYGYEKIVDHRRIGIKDVYDIVGVEGTETYFTNNILSHNCLFLATGDSSIDDELFFELSQKCSDPKIILDNGHYKIWEEPSPEKLYAAGVDISEGVGLDASVIQIFDITDLKDIKQVAVYHNTQIPPLEFTNKLHSILQNWGNPLALIERNNCGAQVVDRLVFDLGYEKCVSYGAKVANRARPQMGMIAHTNTKYKGVLNMRYFVNEIKVVTFRDINTLKEMKDFVRYPNGVWKAKSGSHDDRVMATLYALYILEKELTERYFEVLEVDDQGKPCSIGVMDFGVSMFENPTSIYLDNEVVTAPGSNLIQPIVFGMGDDDYNDMEDLLSNGWLPLQ